VGNLLRGIYTQSLGNLAAALQTFDRGEVYDNTGSDPRLVLQVSKSQLIAVHKPAPNWLREALAGSPFAAQLA